MTFVIPTAALVVTSVLAVSAISHLRNFGQFRRAIRSHAVWSHELETPVALGVIVTEAGLAGIGLADLAAGGLRSGSISPPFLASATLFLIYAGYSAWLLNHRPQADCGCLGSSVQVTIWIPARAAFLSALALLPGFASTPRLISDQDVPQLVIVALATSSIVAVLFTLATAMANSVGVREQR